MGKAQSKRSVDITTEVVAEEGTGRVEKIEDVDQLKPVAQVNGDTQHTEPENQKVVEAEGAENEKDLATEKTKPQPQTDAAAASSAENADVVEKSVGGGETATTPSNNGNGQEETLNESKVCPAEQTTEAAAAPESSKKSKKDKLKKKWSFRSISFGKKDKQKPVKKTEEKAEASKEEVAATTTQVAADTNGECEKVPEEKIAEEQKIEETVAVPASSEVSVSDDAKNEVKPCLNGDSDKISQESEQKQGVVDESNKVKETETVAAVNGAASVKEEEIKEPVVVPSVEKDEGIKINGNVTEDESSKVEVKSNTDIITDPPTTTSVNTQPPPLPLSPQPTQVMVFALSDNSDQQEHIDTKPIDLNITPQLQIPSVIETAPTPEIEKKVEVDVDADANADVDVKECKETSPIASDNIPNESSNTQSSESASDQVKIDYTESEESIKSSETQSVDDKVVDDQKNEIEEKESCESSPEVQANENEAQAIIVSQMIDIKDKEESEGFVKEPEVESKPLDESLNKTESLVEESSNSHEENAPQTLTLMSECSPQLSSPNENSQIQMDEINNESLPQTLVSETEVSPQITSSNIESSESQNEVAPPQVVSFQNEEAHMITNEAGESTHEMNMEEEILPQSKEDIAGSLVEEITQIAIEIVEQQHLQSEDDLPSPPPSPVDNNVGVSNGTAEHSIDTSIDVDIDVETSAPTTDANKHDSTHKENGVSHVASTEESLNGGVEPTKTIEEMKAEHVDTNLSSEDQLPAVVSATE